MKYCWILVLSLLSVTVSHSQDEYIHYSFDKCSFKSETEGIPQGVSPDFPKCECGLQGDAAYFNGGQNYVDFPLDVDSIFTQDFTLDFYFRPDLTQELTDIVSLRNSCGLDSVIAVKYSPKEKSLIVELARNNENYKLYNIKLDKNRCWHRFTLTKNALAYTIYVDNKEVELYNAIANIDFPSTTFLSIGNSPCVGISEQRFRGWIDELKVWSRALSKVELENNYLYPDRITGRDTTIIKGESVNISLGETCSNQIIWNPRNAIEFGDGRKTVTVTPDTTTTYFVDVVNTPRCIVKDSLKVFVVTEDQKDCSKVILPKAFTPNGDNINPTFGVDNTFLVDKVINFEVYDKNGSLLWNTNSISERWDGTSGGRFLRGDVYLYRLIYTCGDKEYTKVDNFALIR